MFRLEVAPALAPAAIDLCALFVAVACTVSLAVVIWVQPRVQNLIPRNIPFIGGFWSTVTGALFQALFDGLALGIAAMQQILNTSATFAHWFVALFGHPEGNPLTGLSDIQNAINSIINAFNTYVNPDLAQLRRDVDSILNAFNTYVNPDLAQDRRDINAILNAFSGYVNPMLAQARHDIDAILQAFSGYVNPMLAKLRSDVDVIFAAFNSYVNPKLAALEAWEYDVVHHILPSISARFLPIEETVGELAPLVAAGALTIPQAANLRALADDPCFCLDFGSGQDMSAIIAYLLIDEQ